MISYNEFITPELSAPSGGSINIITISGEGTYFSNDIDASVGDYISFGFTATAGLQFTCDPNAGKGTGEIEYKSFDIFPLVGDDQPRTVDILVESAEGGKFQLGIVATTI